jgi:hypothetical protein
LRGSEFRISVSESRFDYCIAVNSLVTSSFVSARCDLIKLVSYVASDTCRCVRASLMQKGLREPSLLLTLERVGEFLNILILAF